MIEYVIYETVDEVLITTVQAEVDFIETHFGPELNRDIEDYNRRVQYDSGLVISVSGFNVR